MTNYYTIEEELLFKNQLSSLINDSPKGYHNSLLHKDEFKELLKYINFKTPLLQNTAYKYTIGTKAYWVLNDISAFPKCKRENCKNLLSGNIIVTTGYNHPYCSIKCEMNDPSHKEMLSSIFFNKFGNSVMCQTEHFKNMSHKKYLFENIKFDSKAEIYYYIWLKDNNYNFEYQPNTSFKYLDINNKEHKYYPDFLVNGEYQEIKGPHFFDKITGKMKCPWKYPFWSDEEKENIDKNYEIKHLCMIENNVKIITDTKMYLDYVISKYGKIFIKNNIHKM